MATARKKVTFEEQMAQLQTIVNNLQQGDLSLEDALKNFKEGTKLANKLQTQLDKSQKTLAQLVDENGNVKPAEEKGEDLANNGVKNQGYQSEFVDKADDQDDDDNLPFKDA
ncbi:exodeoxyribonuclease VII small subunit [Limosilactobacillus secaliphilus]|uniref:Exodeoxyribonuclease 7 small subunit n=1 Tax=Limosilactobacillus secaliphilus TaxID=396268 RepID=A0A0R2I9N6_9LACO|nr:exodeoxyribonuclease VII small subunit [Limosilactobacillus secaliphilus]KRN59116.1 hypothetical protein IV45_GL000153 [Limosilactobacillus secaliphilus]